MIYLVALVEPFFLVIVVAVCARLLQSERREHSRREDTLVNQLCNLAGKPWQQAPADEPVPVPEVEPRLYAISPDQAASPLN